MSAVNLGRPSGLNINLFNTNVFTLEKGLMSTVNVGKLLDANPYLFVTKESTLGQGL